MRTQVGTGIFCTVFGGLSIAMYLRTQLTQSLRFRAFVALRYTNPSLSKSSRRAVFALLPWGIFFCCGGLGMFLGSGWSFLVPLSGVGLLLTLVVLFAGVPEFLKPVWFRREESEGFPIIVLWEKHGEEWRRSTPFWERVLLPAAFLIGCLAGVWIMLGERGGLPIGGLLIGLGVGVGAWSAQRAAKRRKALGLKTPIEPPD